MEIKEEWLDEKFLSEEGHVDAEMALDRAPLAAHDLSYAIEEDFDDKTEVQHQLHRYLEDNVSPEVIENPLADARYGAAKIVNEMMSEAKDYLGLDKEEKYELRKEKEEEVSTENLATPAMEAQIQERREKENFVPRSDLKIHYGRYH